MKKYNTKIIKQFIKDSSLPEETRFLGFVINLPESDEYLVAVKSEPFMSSHAWAKNPEMAIVYNNYKKAILVLKEYNKAAAVICLLFDMGHQLAVVSEADFQDNNLD